MLELTKDSQIAILSQEKGARIVAEKILVALKKNDRAEDVLPYVKQLARPGMKVVFLIPDQADAFEHLLRHKGIMETGLHAAFAVKENAKRYVVQARRNFARQKIFLACDELRMRDVEISAEFYSGSLASALKNYSSRQDAHLTMIPARSRAFIDVPYVFYRIFKRSALSSVVLVRPAMGRPQSCS